MKGKNDLKVSRGRKSSQVGGTHVRREERPVPTVGPPATWDSESVSEFSEREAREASPSSKLFQGHSVRTETQIPMILRCL